MGHWKMLVLLVCSCDFLEFIVYNAVLLNLNILKINAMFVYHYFIFNFYLEGVVNLVKNSILPLTL